MKDTELKALINKLAEKQCHIVTAESLTCGMISSTLANISGASAVVLGGPDVYQDEMKTLELGVAPEMLEQHTAVSSEVASSMVQGAFRKYSALNLGDKAANVVVAVTGYASDPGDLSPNGSADTGLVYIGIGNNFNNAVKPEIQVYEHRFEGDRTSVREQTTNTALGYVVQLLKG